MTEYSKTREMTTIYPKHGIIRTMYILMEKMFRKSKRQHMQEKKKLL